MYILFKTLNFPREQVMSLEDSRKTQKPYRYGMILLCLGALINWIALSDSEPNSEPIRYVGVSCILGGALLICTAMCCWLHTPNRSEVNTHDDDDEPVHVITITDDTPFDEKPPNYDQVITSPPSYQEAIKLNPAELLSYVPNLNAPAPEPSSVLTNIVVVAGTSSIITPSAVVSKLKSKSNQNQPLECPSISNYEKSELEKDEKSADPPPYSSSS
jgi:hypothetical protein